jgi:hypothetical protein
MLEDEKERKKCLEVVDEARERVEKMVSYLLELIRILSFPGIHLNFLNSNQNQVSIFSFNKKSRQND